ncbi:IS200/IS605 family transposase [Nostoc sp.]|uniref:IS200/IS605 family transposase n=1 Tax=Nostoc sp. TaxID=1180 RepID=UPI003FA52F7D
MNTPPTLKASVSATLRRLGELVNHISQKWGCEVIEFNGESDHVHLLFRYYPQMQLSKFVNALKSYTSQQIRKEFLMDIRRVYWGKPVFWNSAYFVASCGGVTVEVLKQYVQNQDSPSSADKRVAVPTLEDSLTLRYHPPHSPRQPSG